MTGRYLRKMHPEPQHVCPVPKEAEDRDVWLCDCGRMYIWGDWAGYGMNWQRVYVRYWWYRAMAPKDIFGNPA